MAYLEVNKISIRFGGLTAIDKFDFKVEKGQIVSIIGPNGAGKTTVFNILSGIYRAAEGEITFDGRNLKDKSPQEIVSLGMARTFQNIRLFYDMRVIENVLIGTHIRTGYRFLDGLFRTKRFHLEEGEKIRYAADLLKTVGLEKRIHDYADNLPYGEQRKLEIARAIATGARLLLLDEPAAGMNPQESEELRQFILQLKNQGYTILLIEHDMNVVMNLSDYIYVLDYGKKIAEGKPQEILENQQVVAAYLGEGEVE
ncbi:ABC transporter ATP-binding protein [Mobilitalea sibirica]|uniref:ABC transporter ATP-binding protein n=1 Tax=Mobilitalea sibirica TaxID=1462919 RepID=A0A8J7H4D5_9FIRM|nr:ABC transporter ATP-binding protein [Mobilitalea sibirica]MBH1942180.1 ABC transporter ATP-binding protein [Mobilitalea sibirica]